MQLSQFTPFYRPEAGGSHPAVCRANRRLKRGVDLLLTIPLLLALSPLMLLIALLIRLDSPGPVLFHQQRVGQGGRLFRMFKFRSMVNGAHIAEFRLVRAAPDGGLFLAKSPHDGRVTRLGRFLRRASLDELPQLINVLKGEMSLVGPRPDLPQLLPLNDPRQAWRLLMLPGMTGWWQVNGRMQRAAPHQRLADDLFYLHHWSLGLDMQILGKTVMAVIRGDGAF